MAMEDVIHVAGTHRTIDRPAMDMAQQPHTPPPSAFSLSPLFLPPPFHVGTLSCHLGTLSRSTWTALARGSPIDSLLTEWLGQVALASTFQCGMACSVERAWNRIIIPLCDNSSVIVHEFGIL